MFGINENVYSNLIEYFNKNTSVKRVILFGSRAKSNERYNSDIDLWIECSEKKEGMIKFDIDEIIGCYSCDIIFNNHMNDNIKNQIDRDGIEIYINK